MTMEADLEMMRVRKELFDALLNANLKPEMKSRCTVVVKKKHVGKIIIQLFSTAVTGYERIKFLISKWNKNEYGGLVRGQDTTTLDLSGATGIWKQDNTETINQLVKVCFDFVSQMPVHKIKNKEADPREQLIQNLIARLIAEKCGGKIVRLANDDGDVVNMTHPWVSRIKVSSEWVRISWCRVMGYFSHVDMKYDKFTVDPENIVGRINAALNRVNMLVTNIDCTFRELGNCQTQRDDI